MSFTAVLSSPQARLGCVQLGRISSASMAWSQSDAACFRVFQQFDGRDASSYRLSAGFTGSRRHVDFEVPNWGEFPAGPAALE